MTSLLSVCLALLLPAWVLGQFPIHYSYLGLKCQGNANDVYEKCLKTFPPDVMTSESKCRDVFNEMTKCSGDVFRGCLPQEYLGLVLTDAMATDMVSYLCHHMTEIMACPIGAKQCSPFNKTIDFVEAVCTFLHDSLNCVKKALTCTGSTASVFDTFFQKSIPPACGLGVPLASTPSSLLQRMH